MEQEFELINGNNRNFYCSAKLWQELKKKTKDKTSISSYIKRAIIEKMIKEDEKNKEYYLSMIFND